MSKLLGPDHVSQIQYSYAWYNILHRNYDHALRILEKLIQKDVVPSDYFIISEIKWLLGNPDAVDHFKAGIVKYGYFPEEVIADINVFELFNLVNKQQVRELLNMLKHFENEVRS